MHKPHLQFNFLQQTQYFEHPVEILTTNDLQEVPKIFNKVEKILDEGYYVAGFVSYEAAPAFDSNFKVKTGNKLPLVWFGVFHKPTCAPPHHLNDSSSAYHVSKWKQTTDFHDYQLHMNTIKDAISKGDTYQINYTTRLISEFSGNPYSFYQQLLKNQQASYSAYLDIGDLQILSVSPELFFQVKNNKIKTKPMKGTIGRGHSTIEDNHLIHQLEQSEKDRAENIMIVDLLRNDLGRISQPGTVNVHHLCEIETFPTVHQMTSTIEATLHTNKIFDWFQALFPCGSITGAPKVKTMEYINELEDSPRNIYCGAIGWISPEREAIFNVPIRTVLIDENEAVYGTGSGITWDSNSINEYDELNQKAKVLYQNRNTFSLLESIKLENGNYPLLPFHLRRLSESAQYFQFTYPEQKILKTLKKIAKENPHHINKLRLLLHNDETISTDLTKIEKPLHQTTSMLATKPIHKDNSFLYHKTTNRSIYQAFDEESGKNNFSTLLWNEDHHITEFTLGNVILESNGKFYTPPISDGLLPGTFREKLIEDGVLIEKSIHINEIESYEQLWFINSVRGWVKVTLLIK